MGHPRADNLGLVSGGARRLVVLSPFFLDRHEVTVGAYRRDGKVFAGRWSGTYGGIDEKDYCTFTDDPGAHDTLPLNCVRWAPAREYCGARGGRSAERSRARIRGERVWPEPLSVGRRSSQLRRRGVGTRRRQHRQGARRAAGPVPAHDRERAGSKRLSGANVARGGRSRSARDGGGRRGRARLAGNVSEWARDTFAMLDDECWRPRQPNVFVDPVCHIVSPAVGPSYSVRGSAFFMPRSLAASAVRSGAVEGAHLDVGFRCMRPAR